MGVYKHGTSWWIDYYHAGHRVRERVGPVKNEARIKLAERLEDIRQGRDPRLRQIKPKPFAAMVAEYLQRHAAHRKSCQTYHKKAGILLEHFPGMMLQEITPAKIQDFISTRLASGTSKATTNRDRSALSGVFKFAIERGEFGGDNPVRRVKAFPEPPGRFRFLSSTEAAALVGAAKGHLQQAIVMALHTGGRLSEVLGLKWDDIAGGNVHFNREDTKSGKGREVPISSKELAPHLAEWRKVRNISGYLFTWGGKPIERITTAFNTARKAAGIGKDVTFHTLRHTFASWYMMNGGDLYRLQKLLGHSSISQTERYAHLSPAYQRQGAEFIGAPKDLEGDGHMVDTKGDSEQNADSVSA